MKRTTAWPTMAGLAAPSRLALRKLACPLHIMSHSTLSGLVEGSLHALFSYAGRHDFVDMQADGTVYGLGAVTLALLLAMVECI